MSIDTRPQIVDIDAYGGDTLTLHIKVPESVIGTRVFTGSVRSRRESNKIEASFVVTRIADFGADIQLLSADTKRLSARGHYIGYWDVQLAAPDGSDPVTTLATGELRLDPDVTRKPVT